MTATADETLVAAARAGDLAAVEALLARYEGRILRFSRTMCGRPEDAKDVLQETLLAMARGLASFRGASSLSTWLYTIARSHCIKKRRRSRFAPREVSLDAEPLAVRAVRDPSPGPHEVLAAREAQERLGRALSALDPVHREVIVLRDVEGLTAPEAAAVLGLTTEAVKSRLHRARNALRERLGDAARPPAEACPDVAALFSRHLEGEIDAATCAEMERHVARCPHCTDVCAALQTTLAACRAAPEAEVPPDLQDSVRKAVRAALAGTR